MITRLIQLKIIFKTNNMKENRLPESWSVRNDGSQRFKDTVIRYLNDKEGHIEYEGFDVGRYYGIDNEKDLACLKFSFGKALTIDKFIELSGVDFVAQKLGSDYIADAVLDKEMSQSERVDRFRKRCGNGHGYFNATSSPNKSDSRPITMSLETAREMWNNCQPKVESAGVGVLVTSNSLINTSILKFLLDNFSKEELDGKEGFTWEESFEPGHYIELLTNGALSKLNVKKACNTIAHPWFKNQYRTEKQALSALAFAQLSHICAKANEGKPLSKNYVGVVRRQVDELIFCERNKDEYHLYFHETKDAETSLKVNRALWEQYWML